MKLKNIKIKNNLFTLSISLLSRIDLWLISSISMDLHPAAACLHLLLLARTAPGGSPARPGGQWPVAGGGRRAAGRGCGQRGLAAQAAPRHGGRAQSAGRRAVQARRPQLPSGRPSRRRPKQALQLCSTARAGAGNENISSSNAKC